MVDGQHRMEIKQLMIYKNIKKNLTTHGQNNEISKYTQYPCKPRVQYALYRIYLSLRFCQKEKHVIFFLKNVSKKAKIALRLIYLCNREILRQNQFSQEGIPKKECFKAELLILFSFSIEFSSLIFTHTLSMSRANFTDIEF